MSNHAARTTDSSEPYRNGHASAKITTAVDERDLDRSLENKGLECAIDELLEQIRSATSFSTSLQFDGWEPLGDGRSRHVLSVIREAVRQAVREGGGTHVVVSFTCRDGRREVRVCDDGPFHADGARGDMDHCARMLGGSVTVVRRAAGGTDVRLIFRE